MFIDATRICQPHIETFLSRACLLLFFNANSKCIIQPTNKMKKILIWCGHHHIQYTHKQILLTIYTPCQRKAKYILAASLGVPMLHYDWVTDIAKQFKDKGTAKVFDSQLYFKHRLPIGLDISAGVFVLQRASNARSFLRPGFHKSGGKAVFDGIRIALALEQPAEKEW